MNRAAFAIRPGFALACLLPLTGLAAPDRSLFNFESGTLAGWTAEGGEWTNCVLSRETVNGWREDRRPQGMQGRYLLATGDTRHGQTKDGRLTSDEFNITHDWLTFLLAGEPHPRVRVLLRMAGREVRVAYGNNNYDLRWRGWDVREFKGRKGRLVVEEFSNAHSLIRLDDFRLSDTPPPPIEDWSEMRRQECDGLRYGEWRLAYEPDFKGFIHHTCLVRGHDGQWRLYGTVTDSIYTYEGVMFHAASPKLTGPFRTVQAQSLKADPRFGEQFVRDPFVIFHDGRYWCFYLGSGETWKGWDKNNNWQKGDYGPKSVQGPWHLHLATSTDGSTWKRRDSPLFSDTPFLFTPFITRIGEQWVMYYAGTEPANIHTGLHGLIARTSQDLVNWSERRCVFLGFSDVKWPEHPFVHSPFVWQHGNVWYLLCGPIGNANASRFHYRQLYRSKDPLDWGGRRPQEISELKGLFLEGGSKIYAEGGRQYITHSGPFAGGVWIAPLSWRTEKP
jgi:beta-fructofuranosidase